MQDPDRSANPSFSGDALSKMEKVKITLRIVHDTSINTDPVKWNWRELLDLYAHETVEVVKIEEKA